MVNPLIGAIIPLADIFDNIEPISMRPRFWFRSLMCKSLHRVLGIVHIHSQKSVGNVCRQPDFRIRIAGSVTSFDSIVQKIKKYTAQVSYINGNLFR